LNDDLELQRSFAAMRAEDSAQIPDFEQVLRGVRPRAQSPWLLTAAASLLIAAAVVTLLSRSHGHRSGAREAAGQPLAHWRAPTDFLLDTPGRELLYLIPQIGEPFSGELNVLPIQEPHS
jgi:hypothetical protein